MQNQFLKHSLIRLLLVPILLSDIVINMTGIWAGLRKLSDNKYLFFTWCQSYWNAITKKWSWWAQKVSSLVYSCEWKCPSLTTPQVPGPSALRFLSSLLMSGAGNPNSSDPEHGHRARKVKRLWGKGWENCKKFFEYI